MFKRAYDTEYTFNNLQSSRSLKKFNQEDELHHLRECTQFYHRIINTKIIISLTSSRQKKKALFHEMYALTGKYILKEAFLMKALFNLTFYSACISWMYPMTIEVRINRLQWFTSKD